ncbi:hypothetical protein DY000_02024596 [Brassica cretica]|uniref:Uncharacterized protein n=1 Tax=Brassica cretica TaxID=69181 RepID=A0ABQ7E1K8_BRACR|nr:hypothetical protein DY000_02024596 [Brassica cretica]
MQKKQSIDAHPVPSIDTEEKPRRLKIMIDRCTSCTIDRCTSCTIDRCTSCTIDRCQDAERATWFQPTLNPRCMPSSIRSNKNKQLLFSEDPAHFERLIRKDQRFTSIDAAAFTSTDSRTQPSTDTRPSSSTDLPRSTSIDTTPRTSIDPQSRSMVAIVILRQDENGNLYDQDGHLRNATGQKLDAQGNNPPPQTHESKIEAMLDRVLEGQQQLTVDFNGKIDSAYNSLNTRIETLGTQVRKLEMQVVQTGDTVKRQEEAGFEKAKHHVNAIIDDDFWQVVRHEKLGEGDFEVESSMSFGGSQWC